MSLKSLVLSGSTIDKAWVSANGRPIGFDNLRVILSLSVILWHTVLICYGIEAEAWFWVGPMRPIVYFIVPSFFALSGFLVASSVLRNDLVSFVSLRLIRIYPALAVEVFVSALLIGPIFTTYFMRDYFTDWNFYKYLSNSIGWIHYYLPGVFDGKAVNIQLWTVPYELECYLVLVIIAIFGIHRRPYAFFAIIFSISLLYVGRKLLYGTPTPINERPPGRMIVFCFLFGVALFILKDKIKINIYILIIAIMACVASIYNGFTLYLAPMAVTYITIFLGLQNIKLPLVSRLSNYSYGIYLYGFPIQRVVNQLLPDYRVWWINFCLSALIVIFISILSWKYVESPINNRKKEILNYISILLLNFRHRIGRVFLRYSR